METPNGTNPAPATPGSSSAPDPNALSRQMAACDPDRQALAVELEAAIKEVYAEALRCLETCLTDFREPGSADAKLHGALRNRILNVGNAKARELQQILKNYHVVQVFQRVVEVRQRLGTGGVHDLPRGVRLPAGV